MSSSKPFVLVLRNNEFQWFCREIDLVKYEVIACFSIERPPSIELRNEIFFKESCRFTWRDFDYYESPDDSNVYRDKLFHIWRFTSLDELIEKFPEIGHKLLLAIL